MKVTNCNDLMQQLDAISSELDGARKCTDSLPSPQEIVDRQQTEQVKHKHQHDDTRSHDDTQSSDSSAEMLNERRHRLIQRENNDRFDRLQANIKKKVVMIDPKNANSLFPDLDSSASVDCSRRISSRKDQRNRGGILKLNTRIPLDFKKDFMGVLYSPILEKKHLMITSEMEKRDTERCEKWNETLSLVNHHDGWDFSWEDRIWKGIPHSIRMIVWQEMITKNSGFYTNLSAEQRRWLDMELSKKFKSWDLSECTFSKEIGRDSQVTLPRHVSFQASEGKKMLEILLKVISIHNFQIGYVQGMNLWIGLLLSIQPDDSVFFLVQKLFYGDILHESGFSFYGLNRLYLKDETFFECSVFIHSRLLGLWFPKLEERLEKFGISPKIYLHKWLYSLFVGCSSVSYPLSSYKDSTAGILSWATVLRIWDAYLYYGWDILIIVTVAMLRYYSKEILKMDPTTLMVFFGIDDSSVEANGVAKDSLPTISSPDQFMDLVNTLYHVGKRNRLSFLGEYNISYRRSIDSISSLSSDSKDVRGMSGKNLVNFFRHNFLN